MSQPKKIKHDNSNSFSSLNSNENKPYFNRSSANNIQPLDTSKLAHKKSSKMGSLKKWFSRLGNTSNSDLTNEQKAHTQIETKIANESKLQSRTMSLLLLGAGGSGKSTVLKQMDKIHNKEKYEHEEKLLKDTIVEVHKNIVLDIWDLCKMYYILKQKQSDIKFISSDVENMAIRVATDHDPVHTTRLTQEFAKEITVIWNTKTMKKVYEIRKKSHIMDNTPYFFAKVEQFADPNYSVTFEDYVRIRDQTTGIVNAQFVVEGSGDNEWLFKFTDVGGQRAERRKWLHVFAGIDVVIYVMSLSGYDQVLYEDHDARCWDETLQLFDKTAHNKVFKATDFIIFMNKNDIFEKKIKEIPFTVYKEDFEKENANNGESVIDWVREEFRKRFEDKKEDNMSSDGKRASKKTKIKRGLHFHVTCATDTDQIETVVRYVQLDLIRKLMSRAALL